MSLEEFLESDKMQQLLVAKTNILRALLAGNKFIGCQNQSELLSIPGYEYFFGMFF
ncbi:hypothetical protein SAMN05444410_10541 [Hydrobacter penzbergensis]|jgi:hypothetical protein|uniref:Uncharacterized protein n=1 Tax=Hydrobacter penzbergensis TaxID=1235997 RepID=A0A8X8LB21_9BACT|nr:hypothetical protein CLV53_11379 [Sediminibacterium magnilacihabitans]SDW70060.1 hypothetical protein SAMN05444410_10541 [Hydrobacter penzbergensis]